MKQQFYSKSIYGIEIVAPSELEVNNLIKAAKFLKKHDGAHFKHLLKLDAILVYPKNGHENELFPEKKIWVTERQIAWNVAELDYVASGLEHEACHLKQYYEDGEVYANPELEKEAYLAQRKFLVSVGAAEEIVEWLDEQSKDEWWVYKGEEGGEPGDEFPSTRRFKRFINNYLNKKLNIRKLGKK